MTGKELIALIQDNCLEDHEVIFEAEVSDAFGPYSQDYVIAHLVGIYNNSNDKDLVILSGNIVTYT